MRSFINFIDFFGVFFNVLFLIGFLLMLIGFCLVISESSVHGILYLMIAFVLLTEIAILCKMEFLGLIFIIVYIGAVCVLMLFHIKLIKTFVHRFENFRGNLLFVPFILVVFIIPLVQIMTLIMESYDAAKETLALKQMFMLRSHSHNVLKDGFYSENSYHYNYTNWFEMIDRVESGKILGYLIYDIHFLYLIIGGLILLVAMIGSIFLTLTARKEKKFQKLEKQIFTDISKSVFFWKNKK